MAETKVEELTTDDTLITPEKDRLGYAPFAKYLADSICNMTFAEGFVIAVYGSWGSGKSTLMNFIVQYLQQRPENEQPIIIPFNPWLFSGYQDITKRFFDQFKNILNKIPSVRKGLKETIADIGRAVGEIPLPYAQTGKAVAALFDEQDKDASDLKEEVEVILQQQKQRIVVAIDDIDRLGTEDINQLFRLLKAIPSFTNVVYLLVFDKEVVVKALAETQDASAKEFFDKIIQVSFDLPSPDKTSLRRLLFEKLGSVITDTQKELFAPVYWNNIYYQGLDHFITSLRDIVRLTEHLKLTYATVKDEVNPVDFIALESLRVFCPMIYDIIRKNKSAFVGGVNCSVDELKNLHNFWIAQLPKEDKQPVQNLLMLLFPELEAVWGSGYCDRKQESEWCKQLHVCCPEIFPIYFRLNVSESILSNSQITGILATASDAKAFGEELVELSNQIRPDGTTQLRAFLEQLENYTEQAVPLERIPAIVQGFFDVGEELLRVEDEPTTIFDFSNETRICRISSQLLRRLDEPARFEVLKTAISQGKALSIIAREVEILAEQQGKSGSHSSIPEEEWLISAQHLKELEEIVKGKTIEEGVRRSDCVAQRSRKEGNPPGELRSVPSLSASGVQESESISGEFKPATD